jgi:hypothetical protein
MGRMHDQWKVAKAKAKHFDTSIFNKKFGEALDEYETELARLHAQAKPYIDEKQPLSKAERARLVKELKEIQNPPTTIIAEYVEKTKPASRALAARKTKAKTPAEKKKVEVESEELKLLVEVLTSYRLELQRRVMETVSHLPEGK